MLDKISIKNVEKNVKNEIEYSKTRRAILKYIDRSFKSVFPNYAPALTSWNISKVLHGAYPTPI